MRVKRKFTFFCLLSLFSLLVVNFLSRISIKPIPNPLGVIEESKKKNKKKLVTTIKTKKQENKNVTSPPQELKYKFVRIFKSLQKKCKNEANCLRSILQQILQETKVKQNIQKELAQSVRKYNPKGSYNPTADDSSLAERFYDEVSILCNKSSCFYNPIQKQLIAKLRASNQKLEAITGKSKGFDFQEPRSINYIDKLLATIIKELPQVTKIEKQEQSKEKVKKEKTSILPTKTSPAVVKPKEQPKVPTQEKNTAGILLDKVREHIKKNKGKINNKETAGVLLEKIKEILKQGQSSLKQKETAEILIDKIREQLNKGSSGIENQEVAGLLIDKLKDNFGAERLSYGNKETAGILLDKVKDFLKIIKKENLKIKKLLEFSLIKSKNF